MIYALAFLSALILSLVLTPIVRKLAIRFAWVAEPNQLRWHKNTTALLGGAAIYLTFLISTLLFVKLDRTILGLLSGCSLIFLIGLVDDIALLGYTWNVVKQFITEEHRQAAKETVLELLGRLNLTQEVAPGDSSPLD